MSEEYLWDRTGVPDSEIEEMESLLSKYRYVPKRDGARRILILSSGIAAVLAIAAALSLIKQETSSEWRVAGKQTTVGQTIETRHIAATIESTMIGQIVLSPNSRLEILKSAGDSQRLALRRGTLHATIWAPPSRFVVQTPSASAIDLGCSYTLSVLEDDSSFLSVETGWVAFQKDSVESFIPAGAVCLTHQRLGPGLPYWSGSSAPFRDAVAQYDLSTGKQGLATVLDLATEKDAFTLWHLIRRTSGANRSHVVARFKAFVPGADAEGLRAGKSNAIDAAWDALGLGATGLFRTFQERWR